MDLKIKRKTLRLLSNGVYVMTSRSGERIGAATITWLSQASFKPPLLMAAVRKNSNVFRCFSESRAAAIHIVGSHQKDIAQKFFSPTRGAEGTLNGEPFTEGKTKLPILKNLPSYVECKVIDIRDDYGDHAVVILEVVEAHFHEGTHPLTVASSPWEYGG
ncbi:MAG: flavin reductase family protein [Candidatus Acidiferrales bacterium]